MFERYIGEISQAINALTGVETKKLYDALLTQARKRTAIADLQLDEDGKAVKDEDPADSEGVIIVETAASQPAQAEPRRPEQEPSLLDVEPVKRASAKARASRKAEPKSSPKPGAVTPSKTARSAKPQPQAAASAPAKGGSGTSQGQADSKAKPKLRLNLKTGKLEPVDDGPKLF